MPPVYEYTAVDGRGHRARASERAASETAAVTALEAKGLFVLGIRVSSRGNGGPRLGAVWSRRRHVLGVTRALSSLLGAGIPMRKALSIAEHTVQEPVLSTLRSVRGRVEQGESLADALAGHSELFPPVYVGLVRAGERSADVASSFTRLAGHLERDEEFRSRLVSASIYPAMLAVIGGAAMLLLLFFVLPRFGDLLEAAGATLPRSTAAMLWLGRHARTGWPVALAGGVVLLAMVVWQQTSVAGRRSLSKLLLRFPLTARVRRDALSARFARVLGVLMGGGAPVIVALEGTASSIPDPLTRDEVDAVRKRVREGASLYAAIAESGFFSPIVTELVAVGEESGRFDALLAKSAEILEREVERSLQRLTTIAEPLLIVVFGIVIGFVALSLLQAVYGMNMNLTP